MMPISDHFEPDLSVARPPKRSRIALVASFAESLLVFRGALIRSLVNRGHDVMALAPDISADIKCALEKLGCQTHSVPIKRSSFNPIDDLIALWALHKLFAELKPDVVIPYTVKPVVWGTLAAHAAGIGRIVPMITGGGFAFTGGIGPRRLLARLIAGGLYRRALARADIVLFQNPDDMAQFRRLRLLPTHVPSTVVNGSGVDLRHFSPAPLPISPSFLMISRLLKDKGIREFAAAASVLKRRYPNVAVRLVGFIDESPDSISQGELDRIIDSGIEFLGKLNDVRPAIAQSSVYVLPSYREGTPRSTLEAMAMGRAVITTDAPGCRETVVEGRNGFLVPARDSMALVEAMEKFVLDPKLAGNMGVESRRIAVEKYDVDLVNRDIMNHAGI